MNDVWKYTYSFNNKNFNLINLPSWNTIWTLNISLINTKFKYFNSNNKLEIIPLALKWQNKKFYYGYLFYIDNVLKYYSYSGSLESTDGEYITNIFKVKYLLFNDKIITKTDIILERTDSIIEIITQDDNKKKQIIDERLMDKVFAISIITLLKNGTSSNMNKTYKLFIDNIKSMNIVDTTNTIIKNGYKIKVDKLKISYIDGFKLIPLYQIEAHSVSFILRVWQEKLAMIMVSEELMNMHCCGFPYYYGDIYIYNLNSEIYQNNVFHIKSQRAERINELKARIDNVVSDLADNKLRQLKTMVNFVSSAMTLSSASLCLAQRDIGIVFDNIINSMIDSSINVLDVQQFMFNWVYNIYIMTLRQILHTDLTITNVTYKNENYQPDRRNANLVLYSIPGNSEPPAKLQERLRKMEFTEIYEQVTKGSSESNDEYILMDFGLQAGIIDFSRAIVFATIDDYNDTFPFRQNYVEYYYENILDNVNRVRRLTPDERIFLRECAAQHVDAFFNAIITFDLIIFTDNFLSWDIWTDKSRVIEPGTNYHEINPNSRPDLNNNNMRGQTLGEHFKPLLGNVRRLNELACSIFDSRFALLLEKKYDHLLDLPNPFPTIIKQVFGPLFTKIPNIIDHPKFNPAHHSSDAKIVAVYSPAHPRFFDYNNLNHDIINPGMKKIRHYGDRDPRGDIVVEGE
jgi:hypothetical protein